MPTIPIDLIDRDPHQPRTDFDETTLAELARSIATVGLIQPIVVRPNEDRYTVLVGERRWRAAKIAGLIEVSALVRDITDPLAILRMQIEENQAREELSLWEEATAVASALATHNISATELAARWGWHKTKISRLLTIAKLEGPRATLVRAGLVEDQNAAAYLKHLPDQLIPRLARLDRVSLDRLKELHADWDRRQQPTPPPEVTTSQTEHLTPPSGSATDDFLNAFGASAPKLPDRYSLDLSEEAARELARRLNLPADGPIETILVEIALTLEPILA